jgi:hypothetical protein
VRELNKKGKDHKVSSRDVRKRDSATEKVVTESLAAQISPAMRSTTLGPNNGQAIRLVFFQSEMSILWTPELSRMSRGIVFYLGVLQMPNKGH